MSQVNCIGLEYISTAVLKRLHLKSVKIPDWTHMEVALQPLNKDFKIEFIDADQSQWLTMIGTLALQLRLY